jgi:capsular polysaccharide biosynthesis protein
MEIKDYYLILKRNIWLIVIITVVFALVAYFMTLTGKDSYQSSVAIEVDRLSSQPQSEVSYYQFENYYSQQVSTFISSNISDWMTSASTVAKIFETAGYPTPSGDIKDLGKTFTVRKTQESSSIVDISYTSSNKDQSEKVISAASEVITNKVNEYSKSDTNGKYIVKSDTPVTVTTPKQTTINTIIATFLGFLISLGIVSIREALK